MTFDNKHLYYDNYNSFFYKYNKDLYKILKNYVSEKLELQLMYNNFIKEELDNHIILPKELVYDEKHWLLGYKMDFVNGTNLDYLIKKNDLSFEDKIFVINEFFSYLEDIHYYLIVGDIRNSNLMVSKDKKAYMIDFDYAVRSDSSAVPFCRYQVYLDDDYINDRNADIVKLYVSALSLFYNYNIEDHMMRYEGIRYLEGFIPPSGYFHDYYYYMIDKINKHEYIDNYLKLPITNSLEKEINTGKSRIILK